MSHPQGFSFVVPVSREEWERDLERSVKMGLAFPGETYEQYLPITFMEGAIATL
jgi:hypothetical protein